MSGAGERALRAKVAAHARWAATDDRRAATDSWRAGLADRFLREAREMHPGLGEADLAVRAENLRKAFYSRLALASAVARRARKAGAR